MIIHQKLIQCSVCGKITKKTGNSQKYCQECAEKAEQEKRALRERKREKRRSEKSEWDELQVMDTPENVKTCLRCPLQKCMMYSASCGRMKNRGK